MKTKIMLLSLALLLAIILIPSLPREWASPADGAPAKDNDNKPKLPPDLQSKVDDAVRKGIEALTAMCLNIAPMELIDHTKTKHMMRTDEIILYTLAHCGASIDDNLLTLLERVLDNPLDKTYHVAFQAMALEYIDKQKYQMRIADCAQFLVDTQAKNGQWGYGTAVPSDRWKKVVSSADKKVTSGDKEVSDDAPAKAGTGTKSTMAIKKGIRINRARPGPASGDNSNTQYALLGLRACMDAFIGIPPETLPAAKKALISLQSPEGGWCYSAGGTPPNPQAPPYGSMTAGGMGCMAILSFYMKEGDANKNYIEKSIDWLTKNYNISTNPFVPENRRDWDYYYMYALERAGILTGVEKFGEHNWYEEGCKYLVEKQGENGFWNKNNPGDTCFALLFLKRATAPLKRVITGK